MLREILTMVLLLVGTLFMVIAESMSTGESARTPA